MQFQFVAVHVLRAGTWQETHVVGTHFFAFDPGESAGTTPQWSSFDTDYNTVQMYTDQYRHMQYVFTDPGMYRVQAHVQGHVRNTDDPAPAGGHDEDWTQISPDDTVTSPAEWYTFHVGPEADLGVTLTHTDETSDAATTVTDGTASFSVTATNTGPHTAENTVVEVSLPVGLEYVTPTPKPANVDYACGVISWKVGDLAAGASSIPLTFTANVQTGAPKSLTAGAEVHSSTVDDNEANNTASASVLLSSAVVRPPFFGGATRDIVEHAIANAHAGEPVAANNPDGRDLSYTLSGRCSEWFQVHPHGQIALASGRTLDYDEQSEFHLTLQVSDGVDATGATDTAKSVDDSEPVAINVIDTPDDAVHPTVTFSLENGNPDGYPNLDLNNPVAGSSIRITPEVQNLPSGVHPNHFLWTNSLGGKANYWGGDGTALVGGPEVGAVTYTVHITWNGGGITASYTITWVAPSGS